MTRNAWVAVLISCGVAVGALSDPAAATQTTVSFQQEAGGYAGTADTFLLEASPDSDQGTSIVVEWDGEDAGGQNFGLLRFADIFGPGAGQIPPGSIIVAATLIYNVGNPGDEGTVNEILVSWDESVTYSTFGGEAGVQVDEYGLAVGTADGTAGERTLDVTASLAAWSVDPTLNKGWIFRPTGGTDGVEFYSSEYSLMALRPELEVTFLELVNEVGIHPEQLDAVVGSADVEVLVAIPVGSNEFAPVTVTLTTDDADVAVPAGATGGSLAITFPMGTVPQQPVSIDVTEAGIATLSTTNDAGLEDTTLTVNVSPGAVAFDPVSLASLEALDVPVQVSITPGSNDTRSVAVTLTSDNAAVAEPAGATSGSLVVTFATGAPTEQLVTMTVGNTGNALITTTNDGGLEDSALPVHVITGFMFTATSDTRSYTGPGQFPVLLEAITATGGPGVFLVYPGDFDPPQNVDAAIDAEFGADYDWYPIAGNHEAETPSDMAWVRNEFAILPYIVNTGPPGSVETTYSFDYGNAHFVVLNEYYDGISDTGTDGDIVPALRAWLEADLAANTKSWVFVVGHEPGHPRPDAHWGDARHVGDSLDKYPTNRDAFWAVLDAHNVAAYLTAHTHRYSRYLKDGVWQIDTAQARGAGKYDTFLRLLVGADEVVLHVYRSLDTGTFRLVDTVTIGPFCADYDQDGDVDLLDFAEFEACLLGPGAELDPGCACFDLDGDGQVDLSDLAEFLEVFTG